MMNYSKLGDIKTVQRNPTAKPAKRRYEFSNLHSTRSTGKHAKPRNISMGD
jgi:hypothetical protein